MVLKNRNGKHKNQKINEGISIYLLSQNGKPQSGTFLYAKTSDGKTNSLVVKNLLFDTGYNIVVEANSWYSPLKINREPFSCSGNSPFSYRIVFSSNLDNAIESSAENCTE